MVLRHSAIVLGLAGRSGLSLLRNCRSPSSFSSCVSSALRLWKSPRLSLILAFLESLETKSLGNKVLKCTKCRFCSTSLRTSQKTILGQSTDLKKCGEGRESVDLQLLDKENTASRWIFTLLEDDADREEATPVTIVRATRLWEHVGRWYQLHDLELSEESLAKSGHLCGPLPPAPMVLPLLRTWTDVLCSVAKMPIKVADRGS